MGQGPVNKPRFEIFIFIIYNNIIKINLKYFIYIINCK